MVDENSLTLCLADQARSGISRANYIIRHWRGDMSLIVSFWFATSFGPCFAICGRDWGVPGEAIGTRGEGEPR